MDGCAETGFAATSLVLGPEYLIEAIRHANFEPRQLSAASAPSFIGRIFCPRVCYDFASLGPSFQFRGSMPDNAYTVSFIVDSPEESHLLSHAIPHRSGYMGLFPPGAELDLVASEGYGHASISIAREVFLEAVERGYPEIPDVILNHGIGVRVGGVEAARMTRLVHRLHEAVQDPGAMLTSLLARLSMESYLLTEFLSALSSGCEQKPHSPMPRQLRKTELLRRAIEMIEQSPATEFQPCQLCAELNLSRRSIEYLFQDMLGVAPFAYVRSVRLHNARRTLLESEKKSGLVKQAALAAGFWHMGHFSAHYRTLFGESPSATLDR
jgi:AraC-like DNA-binding protein